MSKQGEYVLSFYKRLEALISDFDQNIETCDWGQTLGSSSSAVADELTDLLLGMKGYKQYVCQSEWKRRITEKAGKK